MKTVLALLTILLLASAAQAASPDYDFAAMIQPAPVTAKFIDPDYYIWCGTMVRGDEGKCHLFYSRWPRKLGHNAWVTHSEVAHAVGDTPLGPFRHKDIALPERGAQFWDGHCTHNPTVLRFGKKFYIYYMGNRGDREATKGLNWVHRNNQRIGVAVADSPGGPWQRFDRPLLAPTPGFYDATCCNNPSVAARPGGGYLMVYKAVGDKGKPPFYGPVLHCVATSDNPTGPFKKYPQPIFVKEGVHFAAEDPFIWSDCQRFWAIVKDNAGYFTGAGKSTALWQSDDGFNWRLAKHPLVATTEITWEGGQKQKQTSLERPQLFFENGRPAVLLFATDTDKNREHSFNVRIPLRAAEHAVKKVDPAFATITDDPKLPRVLIIGDSVSVAYTLDVRRELGGVANVHRVPANCGSTKTALGSFGMERWLAGQNAKWDVIHFNHGLHDLSYRFADGSDKDAKGNYASPHNGAKPNVSLEEYEKNLRAVVARLKKTGAKLIFATTTPVPDSDAAKYVKDSEQPYNEVACGVMREEGVIVDDLWALAKPQVEKLQIPRNVHFHAAGSAVLAKQVAQSIQKALPKTH